MSAINKSGEGIVVGREGGVERRQSVRSAVTGALFRAVFVIGGLVLVFESARNSLTWHLARFWGSAGDNWQNLWDNLLSVVGILKMDKRMSHLIHTYIDIPLCTDWR